MKAAFRKTDCLAFSAFALVLHRVDVVCNIKLAFTAILPSHYALPEMRENYNPGVLT